MKGHVSKGMEMTVYLTDDDVVKIASEEIRGPMDIEKMDDRREIGTASMKIDDAVASQSCTGYADVKPDFDNNFYSIIISSEWCKKVKSEGHVPSIRYSHLAGPRLEVLLESWAKKNHMY